ncbi:efflux RND transporter permease subunit [Isoptericola sp. b515]|uniref:efflux RND transporter permease subunit n=1 Tax=Isoptericola sp. b515 TaxID=3064652 RepID=UPI0027136685|nr:efflux RND transporter permease subunit [Isoptericola sp. b515]MDO8149459.1 efflux RND transporter permease subunit [Isoptericola sp. b515]
MSVFRLARLSLANRAVVALVTVAIFVFGTLSLTSLKQELIPSLQFPAGVVLATYPGASPQVVEENVTEQVEAAVQAVDGIESISSTASTGTSTTTVEFAYGTDMDAATQRLTTAMTQIQSALPEDVEPQVITGSLDDLPVIQLAAAGAGDDLAELADQIDAVLVPDLEDIEDVRSVTVSGAVDDQILIDVDPGDLADEGLDVAQVTRVLTDYGTVVPAGTVTEEGDTYSLQAGTRLGSLEELREIPLVPTVSAAAPTDGGAAGATDDPAAAAAGAQGAVPPSGTDGAAGAPADGSAGTEPEGLPDANAPPAPPEPVLLGDVADISVAPSEQTSFSRLDGEPSLGIAIIKTPQGNTVDVSHAVQEAIDANAAELDEAGITTAVVFDQAPFIEESIEGLATEGGLGLVFAVLIILVFLLSMRATLVSAVSIPLSLATAFLVMDVTGYTLNILTLAALTISIGRVVDDAIVVIENIKRHLSYGEDKKSAILTATGEVAGAIAASTICTVAVFLPLGLVSGMTGELFRPFAFTVAIAMLASLLVALTIVPVLAYWFVKAPKGSEEATDGGRAIREAAEAKERRGLWQRAYVPSLAASLRHPWISLLLAVGILGGTLALVPRLETNFIGDSGQDTLAVTQTFENTASLAAQDDAAREMEQAIAGVDGVETVQTSVGAGDSPEAAFFGGGAAPSASFSVTLDEDADGVAVQDEVRTAVEGLADDGPTTEISVSTGDSGFGGADTIDLVVRATDLDDLGTASRTVQDAVADLDGVAEVTNNLATAQTVLQVDVDREAAAEAGLSETQVAAVVSGEMTPEQTVGEVDLGDGPLETLVVTGEAPETVGKIERIKIPTASGTVRLNDVAVVEEVETPASISRADGQRSATVSVTPGAQDLGTLSAEVSAAIEGLDLPAGATVEVGGVTADQEEAFADLGLALLAAIALVYVIMVATFKSLIQPLILLVSVPLSATGALVALLVTDTPLGVAALIGVLMLVGIVVSNAIVLIDLINQYRRRGRTLEDAVREGARKRLRPIVMTALATIFALTPMAFGLTGGGAFISQPLALVVIGGLISSTLLTLLIVPVLYTLVEGRTERRAARRRRRAEKKEGPVVEPTDRETTAAGAAG